MGTPSFGHWLCKNRVLVAAVLIVGKVAKNKTTGIMFNRRSGLFERSILSSFHPWARVAGIYYEPDRGVCKVTLLHSESVKPAIHLTITVPN